MMFPGMEFEVGRLFFDDIVRLFRGEFPGYRKCNTEYHDLKHTTDTFLATARLIHGAIADGHRFSERSARLGLISALMHDTGYSQTIDDEKGTGAKYTIEHVDRSIDFAEVYFKKNGHSENDFNCCRSMLRCTSLNTDVRSIDFASAEIEMIGKILGTSDLLGQMADRTYIEKLLFLYNEFVEGNVVGYSNEFDLLRKTLKFYELTKERFANELGGVNRFMASHFEARWSISRDLYSEAMEKNIYYLKKIIEDHERDYRNHLRRIALPDMQEVK